MFIFCITGMMVIIVCAYLIYSYNDFISIKNNISNNWANINVLLKQRHDELSKLIDLCKQYMDYETRAFKDIIAARQGIETGYLQNDAKIINEDEKNLRMGLKNLFALAENYPSLQANNSFQQIGNAIHSLESRIAERRELYNASININNTLVQQFPSIWVAKLFHFEKLNLLEFSEAEKADIQISDAFKRREV